MQRYSKKRQAILDTIRSTKSHPSAEWVYAKLKPAYPDLSLATVYRNIRLLQDAGELQAVGVVDAKTRYDGDVSRHAHFVCERCCAVLDVQLPEDNGIDAMAESAVGGRVTRHELLFRGVCKNCI